MLKEEKLDFFIESEVTPLYENSLNEIIEEIKVWQDEIKKSIQDGLKEAFAKVTLYQNENLLEPLGYMIITMLRTEIAYRNYIYKIKVYNENWYFDFNQQDVGEIDFSWCYKRLDSFWDEWYQKRKRYIGVLTDSDVDNIIQILSTKYNEFIVYLCQKAIEEMDIPRELEKIEREPDFKILVGEYMDKTIIIYDEEKDAE